MNLPNPTSYVFVMKVTDQPGAMEMIAATFANRGVSISSSLGNDGVLDPDGRATILVTFAAPPAKKEIIRRALIRLPRVLSLVEHSMDSPLLRKVAVFRLAGDAPFVCDATQRLETVFYDPTTDETHCLLVDTPPAVDATLAQARESGRLRSVAVTAIGL